jgi:MFS family permease
LALSRAIAFSGGNAGFIALLAVLYAQTSSAELVALGAFASLAVPAVASPVAGWLGDRFDRRLVMVISELLGAVCFFMMALFPADPVALIVLRVAASLAAAPLMAATAAALPGLVGSDSNLAPANAKLAAAGISGGLVGPMIAAVLLVISGAGCVFLFNAIAFLGSAALLLSIKANFRPPPFRRNRTNPVGELVAGFRYLGHHPLLRPVTGAYAALFIGVGLTAPAEVALSTNFDAGSTGYAAMTCLFALGGIAGTQLSGRGLEQHSNPTAILAIASGVLAIGFWVVGVAPHFLLVLAGMAVAGAADGVWIVAHENLVQGVTPVGIRSRVFAGSEAVYLGGLSVGLLASGGLIAALGAAAAFQIGAVISLLACLLVVAASSAVATTRAIANEQESPCAPARQATISARGTA